MFHRTSLWNLTTRKKETREKWAWEDRHVQGPKLLISSLHKNTSKNGPFYIESMDYMDTTLSSSFPNHGWISNTHLYTSWKLFKPQYLSRIYYKPQDYLPMTCICWNWNLLHLVSLLVSILYTLFLSSISFQLTPILLNFDLWIPIYGLFHLFLALTNSVFDLWV